jgi:hypothetical protein
MPCGTAVAVIAIAGAPRLPSSLRHLLGPLRYVRWLPVYS